MIISIACDFVQRFFLAKSMSLSSNFGSILAEVEGLIISAPIKFNICVHCTQQKCICQVFYLHRTEYTLNRG